MAVKFSEFTAETVAANITDIVGYQTAGNLNIKIPPANLDTLVSTATAQAGATVTYTLTGTKTGTANTTDVTTFTASGGVTVTAGTNVIDISSLTYTLPITGSAASVTATLTDSNAGVDPVLITGGTNVAFSSITTGGFTIDATDTNTTYDFAAAADGANVDLILTGSEPTTDTVKVTPGTNVNFSSVTAAGFTIDSSASGDTYELNAGAKVGSSVPLNLDANAGADTFVNLTQGTGITITQDSATEITISSTDTVTSVDEKTPGTSTGTPIIVDPTTGAVEVQSMAFNGAANVGHVPTSAAVAQTTHFLRADGTWQIVGALPTKTVNTFTIVGVATNSITVTSTDNPASKDYIDVYINGVYQAKANFNALSVKTLTLAAGNFPDGAVIEAVTTT